MNNLIIPVLWTLCFLFISGDASYAAQALFAQKTDTPPVIDGKDTDSVWLTCQPITTCDKIADIDIVLKAAYDDMHIYFLVKFPDSDESRSHKSWIWSDELDTYVSDQDREDVFQFTWNMEAHPVDLSVFADNPYKADVWFWKAFRADPQGYADDKVRYLSDRYLEGYEQIESRTGKKMYLLRAKDQGTSAFAVKIYEKFYNYRMPGFIHQSPSESCADIKAKGVWSSGYWVIEFRRKLNTGYQDDIQFDTDKEYDFGISRYEVTGRNKPDNNISQPLYACGDVGEELKLVFKK